MSNSAFFIIGAQRAGTSMLSRMLDQHGDIEMMKPFRPEPRFFLDQMANAESFAARFKTGKFIRGEKSTSYIEHPKAAEHIAHHLPNARVIICLRNPIERAISNYWFSVANGTEPLPIAQAFAAEESRLEVYEPTTFSVSPWAYMSRSRYIECLRPWIACFGFERMHVVILERLLARPVPAISGLLDFLGAARVDLGPVQTNAQPRAFVAPPALQEKLREQLEPATRQLATLLNDDLMEWR